MSKSLISAVIAPFVFAALVIGMSHAQPPKPPVPSFIQLGTGPHDEPAVNPELPVLRHSVEHYYDRTADRLMSYEEIDYEDGSATTKIGPHRSELVPQAAPAPADIQPPPCTLITENATIQGNAATGTVHADASVLCRNNGGLQSCSKVGFSLAISQLQADGSWKQINYKEGTSPMPLLCNNRVTPFVNAGVGAVGTYKFHWYGWNNGNNSTLWDLTVQIDYAG